MFLQGQSHFPARPVSFDFPALRAQDWEAEAYGRALASQLFADPVMPQNRLHIAAQHGASNVRVFGSVARGEAGPDSDIDFLVEFKSGRGAWYGGGMIADHEDHRVARHLEAALGLLAQSLVLHMYELGGVLLQVARTVHRVVAKIHAATHKTLAHLFTGGRRVKHHDSRAHKTTDDDSGGSS